MYLIALTHSGPEDKTIDRNDCESDGARMLDASCGNSTGDRRPER